VINPENLTSLKFKKNKAILLINNGIHAEPDGIDATMQLFRDLARQNKDRIRLYRPFRFIISECLNRNSTTRANQDQKYMVLEVTEEIMI
jgi:hypothetical protein